jgi:hypothetical protein
MSDVNTFIDTIGKDVNATVVPQIQTLAQAVSAKAHADYVPKISAFANDLVKQIIDEQSETVRTFVSGVIAELFQRYKPELTGELHAKMVQGAIEVTGQGVTLDLKRRDTGSVRLDARHPGVLAHPGGRNRGQPSERHHQAGRGYLEQAPTTQPI